MSHPSFTPQDHFEAWANKPVPHKLPVPPGMADPLDVVYAEGWNACCDAFFGGKPPIDPVVITVEKTSTAQPLPLSEYRQGQWWIKELDGVHGHSTPLTDNQYRAIHVARNFIAATLSQSAAQPVEIPAGYTVVNSGWLQMVVNALRKDATEGRTVRGEMADELEKAILDIKRT